MLKLYIVRRICLAWWIDFIVSLIVLLKIRQFSCAIEKMTARCAVNGLEKLTWVYFFLAGNSENHTIIHPIYFFVIFDCHVCVRKFPHLPPGVGGCPLGYEEQRCWVNCPCFYVILIHQRHRRSNGRHAIARPHFSASRFSASRGKNQCDFMFIMLER